MGKLLKAYVDGFAAGLYQLCDNPFPNGSEEHMAFFAGLKRSKFVTHPSNPETALAKARDQYVALHGDIYRGSDYS